MSESWSGGCQCGAVRYRFAERPRSAHVCHCRMCQKAFGAFYAPFVGAPMGAFAVTRGDPALFRASDQAERRFCRDCGTPLTFSHVQGDWMSVSIGSLDTPEYFPPKDQHGIEARHYFVNGIGLLPDHGTTAGEEPDLAATISASNRQHPDHDTETWPPAGRRNVQEPET